MERGKKENTVRTQSPGWREENVREARTWEMGQRINRGLFRWSVGRHGSGMLLRGLWTPAYHIRKSNGSVEWSLSAGMKLASPAKPGFPLSFPQKAGKE